MQKIGSEQVTCPQCSFEFSVTETLYKRIKQDVQNDLTVEKNKLDKKEQELQDRIKTFETKQEAARVDYEKKLKRDREKIRKELYEELSDEMQERNQNVLEAIKKQYENDFEMLQKERDNQLKKIKEQLLDKDKEIQELEKKEDDLIKAQMQLAKEKKEIDLVVAQRVNESKQDLLEQVEKETQAKYEVMIDHLNQTLTEKSEALKLIKTKELELIKEKNKIEERLENLELEVLTKVEQEKEKIKKETIEKELNRHKKIEAEYEQLVKSLKNDIENLKRKSEQTPAKVRGSNFENDVEGTIQQIFPIDKTDRIKNGVKGADIHHKIRDGLGEVAGSILWEAKDTKGWSGSWIAKLKNDQREVGADIGIIISNALPDDMPECGYKLIEGVWVANYDAALDLAFVLRESLLEINKYRKALKGTTEKTEKVYEYVTSNKFKQHIEAMMEIFTDMSSTLVAERKALEKTWAKREIQIKNAIKNNAKLFGDIQGIVGKDIQKIESLELDSLDIIDKSTNKQIAM